MARTQVEAAPRSLSSRREGRFPLGGLRLWVGLAALTGAYVGSAKFGINLSVAHGVITPVWAPSGIALAALLLFGSRLWPAVALGALIANGTSGAEPLVAAGIAVGNTLEAVAGAYLLRKVGFRGNLERVRDVLALVVLGAGVSTVISATNGVTILSLADASQISYGTGWLLWWFGDAVGDLLVAPLILVAWSSRKKTAKLPRLLEAGVLLPALSAMSVVVFVEGAWRYPYLIFPLLLWAALRFHQLGAVTSSFLVGAIATWGTVSGTVPIGASSATGRVQIIQALVGVLAISLLALGATLAERENATVKLKQTAARLNEAQALTHIGSWEWVIAPNVVTWSPELYRIWGLDPERFGASYEAFLATVHPDEQPFVDATVKRAFETGGFDYECRIIRSDGSERFIHALGKVVPDDAGAPVQMLGTAQDVTERKELEAERERLLMQERTQNARLRELDRLKDTFIASVSHELRTPLTSISGYIELVHDETAGDLIDEQRRCLAIALRNTERLQQLIGDLLFVSQVDTEHLTLQPTDVDLRALALECIESAGPRAEKARVSVVLKGDPVPLLEGDQARLAQLLDNLVSNAIKFSAGGGRVEVRTYAGADHVVLEVADSGIGIPIEQQPHVFQRFFRSSNAAERAIPGTGLGLSIVKMIVEAHGGSIACESTEGQATTFRIELPLAADSAVSPAGREARAAEAH